MNTTFSMGDIGMAAFSVFFMQRPSCLAHQRQFEAGRGRSNAASLFDIAKIPSANHIRDMPDPASPTLLHPVLADTIEQLGRPRRRPRRVPPPRRTRADRARRRGVLSLAEDPLPTLLDPVGLTQRDGAEKQDRENMAAKRWLAAHGQRYAALDPIYLGDDLLSRQPLCQAVLDAGGLQFPFSSFGLSIDLRLRVTDDLAEQLPSLRRVFACRRR